MATSALVSGGTLSDSTTMAIVSGGTLSGSASTSAIVSGGTLSASAASTKALVTGGYLSSGQVEPYRTINLPSGTWTQIAGPTIAPPTVLAPGMYGGTTLKYTQANGTEFDYLILAHSIFMRKVSDGSLYPVRSVPA